MNLDDMAKAQAFDQLCEWLIDKDVRECMSVDERHRAIAAVIGEVDLVSADHARTAKSHAVMQARGGLPEGWYWDAGVIVGEGGFTVDARGSSVRFGFMSDEITVPRGVVERALMRPGGAPVDEAAVRADGRPGIFAEIEAERGRQDAKWGPVTKQPNVDQVLFTRGADHQRICEEHEIPTATRAKFLCQTAEKRGECSFTAIAVEELCEAVEKCGDEAAMRVELVQLAAVVVKWIEALDLPRTSAPTTEGAAGT